MNMERNHSVLVHEYAAIMAEVKARLATVMSLHDLRSEFGLHTAYEFSYLQFRYITELIALASLVAHDQLDPREIKKLRTTYKASQIFKKLKHLYPGFLMQSVELLKLETGWHFELSKGISFTSDELCGLWNKSGDVLHVGELAKLHKRKTPTDDLASVKSTHDRLCSLLGMHRVLSQNQDKAVICHLMLGSDEPVYVAIGVPNDPRP